MEYPVEGFWRVARLWAQPTTEIITRLHVYGKHRVPEPGEVKPGAAMVALHENDAVVPAAVHGSQAWRLGNFHPVSVAWGEPVLFDGRGYREALLEVPHRIRGLWEFLAAIHRLGRPDGRPPA